MRALYLATSSRPIYKLHSLQINDMSPRFIKNWHHSAPFLNMWRGKENKFPTVMLGVVTIELFE